MFTHLSWDTVSNKITSGKGDLIEMKAASRLLSLPPLCLCSRWRPYTHSLQNMLCLLIQKEQMVSPTYGTSLSPFIVTGTGHRKATGGWWTGGWGSHSPETLLEGLLGPTTGKPSQGPFHSQLRITPSATEAMYWRSGSQQDPRTTRGSSKAPSSSICKQ